MATSIGVGSSYHRNPMVAGREAAEQALQQAAITQPDFVIMFATVGYQQETLLKSVRQSTSHAKLIGCSSAGVITQHVADESNFSIGVMVVQSDEIQLTHGIEYGAKASSATAGQNARQKIDQRPLAEAIALFLFPDGITYNFRDFMRGLGELEVADKPIPIIGGLAGDHLNYEKTYQYYDDQVISDGVAWGLLAGQAHVFSAVSHGCIPIGRQHTITRCHQNRIYEVDDQPVLEVLQSYLNASEINDWGQTAVNMGLAFPCQTNPGQHIIRCLIAKDEEAQAVVLQTEVEQGNHFWLTRRDTKKMADQAIQMASRLAADFGEKSPKLILQIECDGRGRLIFREQEKLQMIQAVQSTIGNSIPWIGFYAFAEIAPIGTQNHLHNFTSVLSAIY